MAEHPSKRSATGYIWCPHCNFEIAERTYRSHRAQFFPDGYVNLPAKKTNDSESFSVDTTTHEVRIIVCIL